MKATALSLGIVLAVAQPWLISAQPVVPAASGGAAAAPTNGSGPQIQFATPIYDFGKANAGSLVKYEFVFTNAGDAMLVVSDVHPSCGCTTAGAWTREVAPGKTGTIPIQFNSGNYPAGPVAKTVTVTSNDKTHPSLVLQVKGTLWKAIDITPPNAILNVAEEGASNPSATIRIVNNMDQPLTLSDPECNNHAFSVELKTVQPGKEFQLIVKTVPPVGPGNVQGAITLKTSAPNMPTLSVMAIAMIQPAVVVSPPQVFLSAGPLGGTMSTTVSIRNNGTNALSLSEPSIDAKGVDVQLKETEPGRQFFATLVFPAGFDTAGSNVTFTVKSSHPKFQVITVPVHQPNHPMNVARALPATLARTNRPALPMPPAPPAATH